MHISSSKRLEVDGYFNNLFNRQTALYKCTVVENNQ